MANRLGTYSRAGINHLHPPSGLLCSLLAPWLCWLVLFPFPQTDPAGAVACCAVACCAGCAGVCGRAQAGQPCQGAQGRGHQPVHHHRVLGQGGRSSSQGGAMGMGRQAWGVCVRGKTGVLEPGVAIWAAARLAHTGTVAIWVCLVTRRDACMQLLTATAKLACTLQSYPTWTRVG